MLLAECDDLAGSQPVKLEIMVEPRRTTWFQRLCLGGVVLLAVTVPLALHHRSSDRIDKSPDALLKRADDMAWNNVWIQARPLYYQAEVLFDQQGRPGKALYAHVSQIPAISEWSSTSSQIAELTNDLALPGADDPATRLRILTVRGMLETNYDAALARSTWAQVQQLAQQQNHYLLASRAIGEQGISAYLLGDVATAKKQVITALTVAKYLRDPAARVRYASVYGAGLVELQQYGLAVKALDSAIKIAASTPGVAYPTIAIMSKVDALSDLGQYHEALSMTNQAMQWATKYQLPEHLAEIQRIRGNIYRRIGELPQSAEEYSKAVRVDRNLSYWRGLTQVCGELAQVYEQEGQLSLALESINEAISANRNIPDELYSAPHNLALKAELLARMGQLRSSNELYQKSADLIDAMLAHVPTPDIERDLLSQLSAVYAGYFQSLSTQHRYAEALNVIEKARGRLEAQALQHHEAVSPHAPTLQEHELTRLNIQLLDTDDAGKRALILENLESTENNIDAGALAARTAETPVTLHNLQQDLAPSELIIEYVLNNPQSYVLAITRDTVHSYPLAAKNVLESKTSQYLDGVRHQKASPLLAQELFTDLLSPIAEYKNKQAILIVPDGKLSLLPFSALMDGDSYVLKSHATSAIPPSTVLHLIRGRERSSRSTSMPYVGVAAWTTDGDTMWKRAMRSVEGPVRSEFVALPKSRHEVEAVGATLPQPSMVLLGASATETRFKQLPLERYDVLHLALHGYADLNYPDRSALAFAPEQSKAEDGLLQVREIRHLKLNASLVTLSACDTGIGPVGEAGVANISNAFIEAGAQSVVTTLWALEDRVTAHFMLNFYTHLAAGMNKEEALRQAQLDLLNAGFAPFSWASFEITGEPNRTLFNDQHMPVGSETKGAEWLPQRTPMNRRLNSLSRQDRRS